MIYKKPEKTSKKQSKSSKNAVLTGGWGNMKGNWLNFNTALPFLAKEEK
jgi:hypothetical protein